MGEGERGATGMGVAGGGGGVVFIFAHAASARRSEGEVHTHDWTQRLEARLGSTFGNVYHIDQHDDSVIRHGTAEQHTS